MIKAVSRWKNISEIYSTAENIDKASDMLLEVDVIMHALGTQIPATKAAPKCCMFHFNLCFALFTEYLTRQVYVKLLQKHSRTLQLRKI